MNLKILNLTLIKFILISILFCSNVKAACNLCVNIETFNKPKDSYFIKLINNRVKNIKKDLNIIKENYKNVSNFSITQKKRLDFNLEKNLEFFLNNYKKDYQMPTIRAKKASKSILQIFENLEDKTLTEWKSGYYKGYILPLETYINKDNEYCRVYAQAILKNYHYNIYKNVACQNNEGNWTEIDKQAVIKDKFKKYKGKNSYKS